MKRWYAVNTQPRAEDRAMQNLLRQGFQAYLPQVRKTVRHARKTQQVRAPLFPSYLFVALDLGAQAWHAINGTFGVRHLITNGDRPAALPDGIVEGLQSEQDGDGLLPVQAPDLLRPGSQVEIVAGGLAEKIATILRLAEQDRVVVLLDMLGRTVETSVPMAHVRKVV